MVPVGESPAGKVAWFPPPNSISFYPVTTTPRKCLANFSFDAAVLGCSAPVQNEPAPDTRDKGAGSSGRAVAAREAMARAKGSS